ncbi:MAG: hypothetical protein AB1758_30045, partial [Candidatus Eremiobacterota bacterium]
ALKARVAQCEEALHRERRESQQYQRLAREALRSELREQTRLQRRLAAAQDRIRELEELVEPLPSRPGVSLAATSLRVWVDGWAACCSLS